MSDGRKRSIYLPASVMDEREAEARRLDRSVSWLLNRAWHVARASINRLPGPRE